MINYFQLRCPWTKINFKVQQMTQKASLLMQKHKWQETHFPWMQQYTHWALSVMAAENLKHGVVEGAEESLSGGICPSESYRWNKSWVKCVSVEMPSGRGRQVHGTALISLLREQGWVRAPFEALNLIRDWRAGDEVSVRAGVTLSRRRLGRFFDVCVKELGIFYFFSTRRNGIMWLWMEFFRLIHTNAASVFDVLHASLLSRKATRQEKKTSNWDFFFPPWLSPHPPPLFDHFQPFSVVFQKLSLSTIDYSWKPTADFVTFSATNTEKLWIRC